MGTDSCPRLLGQELDNRPAVKHSPLDRGALDHCPLFRLEPIDAGSEQRLDRRRNLELSVSALRLHRHELLGKERVPLRRLDDPGPGRIRQNAELVDEHLGLVPCERVERHQACVGLRCRPPGPELEEVGPGRAEQEQRRVLREGRDVLDQVEQRRLGPVDVVEDDDQRPCARDRLVQLAEAPGDLLRRRCRLGRPKRGGDPRGGKLGFVALSECGPQVAHLRDDLAERPVGDPFPVGEAATDEDARF